MGGSLGAWVKKVKPLRLSLSCSSLFAGFKLSQAVFTVGRMATGNPILTLSSLAVLAARDIFSCSTGVAIPEKECDGACLSQRAQESAWFSGSSKEEMAKYKNDMNT